MNLDPDEPADLSLDPTDLAEQLTAEREAVASHAAEITRLRAALADARAARDAEARRADASEAEVARLRALLDGMTLKP